MKTVKQQAEVLFQSLDFADKVMLLPIMNMLAESVKENESIEITITVDNTWHLEPKYARKALKVLSDLGCRTPLGESYEDIIKSDDSQKNACVLFLQHRGDNPLNVVKLIKEALNIGLREAKDLVDSYPVKIDLSNFQTLKPEEYKNFAIKLEEKGAIVTLEQKSIN